MWAGISTAWGQASKVSSSRSRAESPKMGRPSEWRFPPFPVLGKPSPRLQAGQQDHIVNFPGFSSLLVNGADLSGNHEPGVPVLQPLPKEDEEIPPQTVKALFPPVPAAPSSPAARPESVRVPGSQQSNSLFPSPQIQMGPIAIPAGGHGIVRMNVQIGVKHKLPPGIFPHYRPFFSPPQGKPLQISFPPVYWEERETGKDGTL